MRFKNERASEGFLFKNRLVLATLKKRADEFVTRVQAHELRSLDSFDKLA